MADSLHKDLDREDLHISFSEGLKSSIPSSTTMNSMVNKFYYCTDTEELFRWNGSNWKLSNREVTIHPSGTDISTIITPGDHFVISPVDNGLHSFPSDISQLVKKRVFINVTASKDMVDSTEVKVYKQQLVFFGTTSNAPVDYGNYSEMLEYVRVLSDSLYYNTPYFTNKQKLSFYDGKKNNFFTIINGFINSSIKTPTCTSTGQNTKRLSFDLSDTRVLYKNIFNGNIQFESGYSEMQLDSAPSLDFTTSGISGSIELNVFVARNQYALVETKILEGEFPFNVVNTPVSSTTIVDNQIYYSTVDDIFFGKGFGGTPTQAFAVAYLGKFRVTWTGYTTIVSVEKLRDVKVFESYIPEDSYIKNNVSIVKFSKSISQTINTGTTFNLLSLFDINTDVIASLNILKESYQISNKLTANAALKMPAINKPIDYSISVRLLGTIAGSGTREFSIEIIRAKDGSLVTGRLIDKLVLNTLNNREETFETYSIGTSDNFVTDGIKINVVNPSSNSGNISLTGVDLIIKARW